MHPVTDEVTRRIEVVAREGDGKMSFEPNRIAVKKGWPIVAAYNRAGAKLGQDIGRPRRVRAGAIVAVRDPQQRRAGINLTARA